MLFFFTTCTTLDLTHRSNATSFKSNHSLRVSDHHFGHFLYTNKNREFDNGIAMNLIKTIAEIERVELSFQTQRHSSHFGNKVTDYDVYAGGIFPNVSFLDVFNFSKLYYQEELIWCIQTAKNYPMAVNVFLATTPLMWFFMIVCMGGSVAVITYIMIPFDLKNPRRNFIDFNYTTFLIVIPMVMGSNLRHFPQMIPCRSFYALSLLTTFFLWQILFCYGGRFIIVPVQRHQISTVAELIENDFRLAGSKEVFNLIKFDERVC